MKLYAPSYYKKFKCTADKCEHSCCIGWEIDVDSASLQKYKALSGGYGEVILSSIADGETPHFKLCERDRCPHLSKEGLCNIILNLGEDYLCDVCREHPRFYNYTAVKEVGLGMSCPAAAEIILSSRDYAEMELIGSTDGEPDGIEFDGRAEREAVYKVLGDEGRPYKKRLETIYEKYGVSIGEDGEWLDAISSLEYLDDAHRDLFMRYSKDLRPDGCDGYFERFLAYFVYRHCTEAGDLEDFRIRLAFCLFCERLFASLSAAEPPKTLKEAASLARIISEEIEYSDDNTAALTALAEELNPDEDRKRDGIK